MPSLFRPPISSTSLGYGLFISHAWDYALAYRAVVLRLNADKNLKWKDLSVPIENPIQMLASLPKSNRTIVKELEERIKQADALLVLAGMYVHHSGWIQSEIEIALDFSKPIIGIRPRGQERIPAALDCARELVGWTTDSIASAVRKHARPTHLVSNSPDIAAPNMGKTLYPPPSFPSKSAISSGGINALRGMTPPPTAPQNIVPTGGLAGTDNLALLLSLYGKK